MFEGTEASAPFGGGPGEQMFKSFMTEAMAGKMVKSGGVGIAATVQREMLRLQGLHQ
jgi:Rod binding domain-containing protein